MLSMLPSCIVLGLVALVAAAQSRWSHSGQVKERRAAAFALAVTTGIQGIHFAEEAATGFHERFPALFGLQAIPQSIFIAFNVIWLGIWIVSVPGLRSARPIAFFAAWFLALAGMLNGVAHPLLAIAVGGYFPGLLTSAFIGIAGAWLWLRLGKASAAIESN